MMSAPEASNTDVKSCSAVLVHYGEPAPTLAQIDRVRRWAAQIVVIANDGTSDHWYANDPVVTWLVPGKNLGYGGAANYAYRYAQHPVVAVLNTDIVIPDAVARQACDVVMNGAVAIVGLQMSRPNGEFLSGAGTVTRYLCLARMQEPSEALQVCQWVTGAAMFIRGDCLGSVGFDERYFLGMEDVDFCVRAEVQGFTTAVLRSFDVLHESGKVIGPARWYYYSSRNPIWFTRSQRGSGLSYILAMRFLALLLRVGIADVIKARGFGRARRMALGIWHGLVLRPMPGEPPYDWEPLKLASESARFDVLP